MKLKITGDKLTISAAHMLSRHDKCSRLHGHNYNIVIEIEGDLNEKHMIVDFSEFKEKIGIMLKQFDHKLLIPQYNEDFIIEEGDKEVKVKTCEGKYYRFPKEDVKLLPLQTTTVELLSQHIHALIKKEYPTFKVQLEMSETPTSFAIFSD